MEPLPASQPAASPRPSTRPATRPVAPRKAPPAPPPQYEAEVEDEEPEQTYSSGLFACFDDGAICCLGCFAPCYLSARVMHEADGREGCDGDWCCCACLSCWCLFTEIAAARSAVQQTYGIEEDEWTSTLLITCCPLCVACQDAREVRLRRAAGALRPQNLNGVAASVSTGKPPTVAS